VLELLVVMAILAILAGLILPALSRARGQAQSISCLNNLHQVILACHLYASDHEDAFPNNYGSGDTRRTIASRQYLNWVNNVMNWETSNWGNTNEALVLAGGLGRYSGGAPSIFRCPSDRVLSDKQREAGWTMRTRSISMNAMLGDAGEFTKSGKNVNNPHYQQFFRMGHVPDPSRIFAFIEEHPDSINDGYFLNQPPSGEWFDLPASYHSGGANLVFVDGHAELRRWQNASTCRPARAYGAGLPFELEEGEKTDFYWLMNRTSAKNY
jgi:prepilin-type processing-associated H-X9-DG protein